MFGNGIKINSDREMVKEVLKIIKNYELSIKQGHELLNDCAIMLDESSFCGKWKLIEIKDDNSALMSVEGGAKESSSSTMRPVWMDL